MAICLSSNLVSAPSREISLSLRKDDAMDVKMGTAESSQSSEGGGVVGLTSQTSFHRQSPNIARLIRSENSSKMEYEFPITEGPTSSSSHHQHQHGAIGSSKHPIIAGHSTRQSHSPTSEHPVTHHTGYQLGYHDTRNANKRSSTSTSNLWFSLTSCFGCRMRNSSSSAMNPLRDKVHAIRIVRASNDLTPAVFDSHYNIITLEQLRECDPNASANVNALPNDLSNASPNPSSSPNGNGSVVSGSTPVGTSKKDTAHRMRKKKKKRAAKTKTATGSDEDDDENGSART